MKSTRSTPPISSGVSGFSGVGVVREAVVEEAEVLGFQVHPTMAIIGSREAVSSEINLIFTAIILLINVLYLFYHFFGRPSRWQKLFWHPHGVKRRTGHDSQKQSLKLCKLPKKVSL